jgi:hypothetical protein
MSATQQIGPTSEDATARTDNCAEVAEPATDRYPEPLPAIRRRLPDERRALTHHFSIAGQEGYLTVGVYEDGLPGEIFITMAKQGSTISGLMDAFATVVSLALQHGVPLRVLCEKLSHMRFEPSGWSGNPKIGYAKANASGQSTGPNGGGNDNHGHATTRQARPTNGGGNGQAQSEKANGSAATGPAEDLDERILGLEKAIGSAFYRNILREYGRVNQPKLIRDAAVKRTVLQMLESVARGIDRLEAVTKRMDPKTVEALLAKLQAPPLGEITDIKTLQHVVLGLEELAGPNQTHAA